ncbi:MAG: hypothetical protein ACOCVL_03050, partial [Candidatus Sumerlaeota bacterium]
MPRYPFVFRHNGLALRMDCDEKKRPRLTYLGLEADLPNSPPENLDCFLPFQVQGEQETARYWTTMGAKRHQSLPGLDFVLEDICEEAGDGGPRVLLETEYRELQVRVFFQFYDNCQVIRSWLEIENIGDSPHGLELLSSFFMHHLAGEDWSQHTHIHLCHNRWCGE